MRLRIPKTLIRILAVLVCCQALAAAANPANGFVTDQLQVELRSGQGTRYPVKKLLASGTPLTILDRNPASGYSRVKVESGEEGWVLTKYLSTEPAARGRLEAAEAERRKLEQELVALRGGKEVPDPETQRAEIDRLNTELIAIRQASTNAVQILEERDRLHQRVIGLERDLETLRREKHALDGDYRQNWFLIGAGVLFGGIVLGLLLPKLGWRKKSSWDSF